MEKLRTLRIPDQERANPRRFVALDLDGETQAYAIYRTHNSFDTGVSSSRTEIIEAIGATPQATAEIWGGSRHRLDGDVRGDAAAARPSVVPAARESAPGEIDWATACGWSRRRRCGAVGPRVSR